jgi:hypothetical protein
MINLKKNQIKKPIPENLSNNLFQILDLFQHYTKKLFYTSQKIKATMQSNVCPEFFNTNSTQLLYQYLLYVLH